MAKKNPHLQNLNWKQQMALQPQIEAIKPFVIELVENLANQSHQQLARQQLGSFADILTTLSTIKSLLISKNIVTEDEITQTRMDIEDKSFGITRSDEGAANGDYVRLTYKARENTSELFGAEQRQNLSKLGQNALPPEVESAIVGMKAGEAKTVEFTVVNKMMNDETQTVEDVSTAYVMEFTVNRVSKYPTPPAAPAAPEAPVGESSNG